MPRPVPRFHDYIGHKEYVDFLRRLLEGALARSEPFPHTLLSGTSGVGKTRLARALAAEFQTSVFVVLGSVSRRELSEKLASLKACDFLFIDECHRLGPAEQELLIEAIDQNSIPPIAPRGSGAQPPAAGTNGEPPGSNGRVVIPPWSLVLATDQPGRLLNALTKRVSSILLPLYPLNELKEIVAAMTSDMNMLLSPQAAKRIAEVAAGLPRDARQHLKNLRLFHPDAESSQLGIKDVEDYLAGAGVDASGLGPSDRRYLQVLMDPRGAALESIALLLGIDTDYVRRQIEPRLVRHHLVRITSAGRQLTTQGRELMRSSTEARPPVPPDGDPS